ncbi:MAG TPA: hypothetical protein VNG90_00140 [Candidatus Acidoferrum sp.]|nr:hypothetical protein [Candidatus Acidoferrum sp.]
MPVLHVMGHTAPIHVLVVCGAGREGSLARARLALETYRRLCDEYQQVVFALMGGTSDSDPFPPDQMEYQMMLDYLLSQGVDKQLIYHDGQQGRPSGTTYQNILYAIRKGFIKGDEVLHFFCADLQEFPIRRALHWKRFPEPSTESFIFSEEKYGKLHSLVYLATACLAFGSLEIAVWAEKLFVVPYYVYLWAKALGGLRR